MGEYRTLQKLRTITGDTATGGSYAETQPLDEFLDVSGWDVAFVTVHTTTIDVASGDSVEISVGTVDTSRSGGLDVVPNGAAGVCVVFDGVTSNEWHKAFIGPGNEPQGAGTYPLENLLGWNVNVLRTTSGGPFNVTFEIAVTLKRAR